MIYKKSIYINRLRPKDWRWGGVARRQASQW